MEVNGNLIFNVVVGGMLSVIGFLLTSVYNDVKYLVKRESESRVYAQELARRVTSLELQVQALNQHERNRND